MEESARNESGIRISLANLGTVNKNSVCISNGTTSVSLYFSYETLIAVNQHVSVNTWSKTTGKFLNELQPDKTKRIPHTEVIRKANELIAAVLYPQDRK